MDLDHILFLTAMLSCAVRLAGGASSLGKGRLTGWTKVAIAILAVGGLGMFFFPARVGWVTGALWLVFMVLPSLLSRVVMRHTLGERYARADRVARIVRMLHPADDWREAPELYRAQALAQSGEWERAAALLDDLAARPGVSPAVTAVAQVQRFIVRRGQWEELLAWIESHAVPAQGPLANGGEPTKASAVALEPSVMAMRVRALGETGRVSEMLAAFEEVRARLERVPHPNLWPSCQLALFAFTGREAATAALLDGPLTGLAAETKTFWRATAAMAAGRVEAARTDFQRLADHAGVQTLRRAAERRLTHDVAPPARSLSPADNALLDQLETVRRSDSTYHPRTAGGLRRAHVTLALVALNLAMFGMEIAGGGSEQIQTLYTLGAMWPPAVLEGGEWWRLVAALFLHLGPVHLAMNMLALALIGPWVEQTLGRARYAALYFLAGIGSMAAVLGFIHWGWMKEEVLVGASGAIMGLIGAMGALLAVGWRRERSALAARRLRGVALVVALQVVFDLTTPQVSFAAHAAGVVVGFLVTPVLTSIGKGKAAQP